MTDGKAKMTDKKITTAEEALEAVKKDGLTLQYVPEKLKTLELCLEAVKNRPTAIEQVPEKHSGRHHLPTDGSCRTAEYSPRRHSPSSCIFPD